MTSPVEPFTQTSDKPYIRHDYKLTLTNGQSVITQSWEEIQTMWFQLPSNLKGTIEVLDKKKKKTTSGGFM